ncbi:MAG TPA: 16S rRNA (adenine(1518)-N(6)/adenine(1519)-N(6))-dimethyltransferase RsmA [Candidatus Acidoferrales bacterium]|nr:16S rRNA (adenine(1518)-N(6)/adenine(1519)-N(6))-dimethyltransferase RsmA [Candidatus Acidoferrales bacterium]
MSRQKLGQHFLANPAWLARIIKFLPVAPDATWLEIGAGHGEMTEFLARFAHRVIAVETDASLARRLRERATLWPNVQIVHADILKLDLHALIENKFFIYGNLPYYITSPILHHLFQFADKIHSIHIVVQLEVAARIAAQPGRRDYGYLSAFCQFYADPLVLLRIPPGAFRPPPKIFSALVQMRLPGQRTALDVAEDAAFLKFLQKSFAQKRKTIRNNLRAIYGEVRVETALATCNLNSHTRAEELSLPKFAALFNLLHANSKL